MKKILAVALTMIWLGGSSSVSIAQDDSDEIATKTEQEARQAQREARRLQAKERFEALSEETQAAIRERRQKRFHRHGTQHRRVRNTREDGATEPVDEPTPDSSQ